MTRSPAATPLSVSAGRIPRVIAAVLFLLLLAGYLIFNRSFARLGFPPFYVGECVLGCALFAAFFDFDTVFVKPLKRSRTMQLIALFFLYGAVRGGIDYFYSGMEALRDAVICLYAVAAFLAPWLLTGLAELRFLNIRSTLAAPGSVNLFVKFLMVITLPALFFDWGIYEGKIAPPAELKVDFLTLSAVLALVCWSSFLLSRIPACIHFFGSPALARARTALQVFFAATVSALAALLVALLPTRALQPGALLSALVPAGLVLANAAPRRRRVWSCCAAAVVLAIVFGVYFSKGTAGRERMWALFDSNDTHFKTREGQLAAHSEKWRMAFWGRCAEATVTRSPLFGLGFGLNLTDLLRDTPEWPMFEDSQNAAKYGSANRNPHCAHVTVFTRLGLLGLGLWSLILLLAGMRGLGNCLRHGDLPRSAARWSPFEAEVFCNFCRENTLECAWLVYLLAMSLGVVLENPYGGIWFWSLTGLIVNRELPRID